jgi:hypothetical protein
MPPKKTAASGAALLREARSQKRKATSPTPQEEDLDQEIRDLEAIHPQVQKKGEKMLQLAELHASSQKVTNTLSSSAIFRRSPKLAHSIVLCLNPSTSTKEYPTSGASSFFLSFYFLV